MTDDGRKKPPPRPTYPRSVEPFKNLTEPSHVEAAATMNEVLASHRETLRVQRQMALQLDGFMSQLNTRLDGYENRVDVFHRELAMLRETVTGDHAPRLGKVETTLGQKVARGGGLLGLLLVAAPLVAEQLPKYRALIEALVGALP